LLAKKGEGSEKEEEVEEEDKGMQPQKSNKGRLRTRTQSTPMKRPAAARAKCAEKGAKASLDFPGSGKRKPLTYGNSKIYFSPDKYRLMEKLSDKVDKQFSHKACDPKEAWARLAKRVRTLNP